MTSGGASGREAWLAEGNARQARKRVAAKALITDHTGRVLLVNPTYKQNWDIPGGMAEANEPPRAALQREIAEELGLTMVIGRLLTVDWIAPHGPWDDQLVFLFDCGTLTAEQAAALTITDSEISDYEFFPMPDATRMLRSDVADRLTRAIQSRDTGMTHYTEAHAPTHPE